RRLATAVLAIVVAGQLLGGTQPNPAPQGGPEPLGAASVWAASAPTPTAKPPSATSTATPTKTPVSSTPIVSTLSPTPTGMAVPAREAAAPLPGDPRFGIAVTGASTGAYLSSVMQLLGAGSWQNWKTTDEGWN